MEHARVMTDPERIDTYSTKLTEPIRNVSRSFVLNMDEIGLPDSVGVGLEKVTVPTSYRTESVPIPVESGVPPGWRSMAPH
jgi:hypothetical protein